jgi:hypothetical protein
MNECQGTKEKGERMEKEGKINDLLFFRYGRFF